MTASSVPTPTRSSSVAELSSGNDPLWLVVVDSVGEDLGAREADALRRSRVLERRPTSLRVAIDLNAVPPLGIAGIKATDKAKSIGNVIAYGAIGVGGLKMKTHKAALKQLFESNEQVLDAAEIYEIAKSIG